MIVTLMATRPTFVDSFRTVRTDGRLSILSAVGAAQPPRCLNLKNDVEEIQAALNLFSPSEGGPLEKLTVDGISGTLTRGAIKRFQQKSGLKIKDGIVDVDGATIDLLRAGPDVLLPNAPNFSLPKFRTSLES